MTSEQVRSISDGTLAMRVFQNGGEHVIWLCGELDLANAATAEAELEAAMTTASSVVVDMRELEFIDSTGIALLVSAMTRNSGPALLRFVPSEFPGVTRVLEVTGIADRMPLADGPSIDGLLTA
jgi:anti-anti-sigma factor